MGSRLRVVTGAAAGVLPADSYPEKVRLAVGTVVAYPPHGVGRVAAREKRVVLGVEQEIVVIDLAEGLSVTLPLERARVLLRPPASEADLRRVRDTLRENGPLSDDAWATRLREMQEKLRRGDLLELAQIVRDGVRREGAPTVKGVNSKLSVSERAICVKARELLSDEIGLVRGVDQASANAWIDDQLTSSAAA
jgi:CarD family transcriptional regulator